MSGIRGRRPRSKAAKRDRNTKVLCGCGCGKRLSNAQSARHMRGLAPGFIAASSAYRRAVDMNYIQTGLAPAAPTAPAFLSEGNVLHDNHEMDNREIISDYDMNSDDDHMATDFNGDHDNDSFAGDAAESGLQQLQINVNFSEFRQRSISENVDSSDTELEDLSEEDRDEDFWIDDLPADGDDPFSWTLVNGELTNYGRDLSAEELLGEDFEREAANNENRVTDQDIQILRAFQFKHAYFLSQNAFKALPYVFPQIHIPSIDLMRSRIERLSGLRTVTYDCCVNSCCCFVGGYENDNSCRFCSEPRYLSDGKTARKQYRYTPLIPRLRAMYENQSLCQELLYRHEYPLAVSSDNGSHTRTSDDTPAIADIWDGRIYRDLRNRNIKINGKELHTKYFSDPHDIALGLTTDGFCPWRKRKYTAWPILLVIYNLPPDKRNHQKNIIPLSIIPGPKKPKDVDSFLYPLVKELFHLSNGVRAFDASTGKLFCLRAFLILAFGDIPAVSLIMKMKGHNGIAPCRCCNIHGVRVPENDGTMHYVPLDCSSHPEAGSVPKYDPKNLPMRTHEEFLNTAERIVTARTRAEEELLAKDSGIKGKSILTSLDSLSFPSSFPYDFMHLIYENLIKNLILLWTNDFKGLNTGTGSYALSSAVWEAIGSATAEASDTIPSAYSTRIGSISGDRSTFTADNYSFWTLYIGPVLLQRKFSHQRYYDHFVELVRLLLICLKYEYTSKDLKTIRDGFISWVITYERLYYQHSPARLATCPLTIHALLHIADGIEACGPVWAYWAYPMERYCGLLQRAVLSSRRHPYVTLDRFIAEDAMLSQLKMRYNLYSELRLQSPISEGNCLQIPAYPTCVLLPPHSVEPLPSVDKDRISAAIATRFDVSKTVAKRHIPHLIEQWGKVRRIDGGGGDTMVAALLGRASLDRRDATHVRYETLVDMNARNRNQLVRLTSATFYGQLLRIFSLTVKASREIGLQSPETVILVEIQPCKIISDHRTLDIHYYKSYGTPSVFDVTCVQCLVGRVKLVSDGGASEWAIFDRSGTLARAYYTGDDQTDN